MENSFNFCKLQYELVRESRAVLFNYCKTISEKHFIAENNLFGRGGSIRNILVHIANTYEFWIAKHGLNKAVAFTNYHSKQTISEIKSLFDEVDNFVGEFIALLEKQGDPEIQFEINGIKNNATAFKLYSHVITHEFHHKGQILSLSRQLGYLPVDADIMR